MAEEELGIRSKRETTKLTTPYITKTDVYAPGVFSSYFHAIGIDYLPFNLLKLVPPFALLFQWCTLKALWVKLLCPHATPLAEPSVRFIRSILGVHLR